MTTTAQGQRAEHHGKAGEFFAIFIVNLIFTILTLGIYRFWAKARIRRYLWSQSSFDGERFEYTGNGLEVFLGFLKVLGLALVGLVALGVVYAGLSMISPLLAAVPLVAAYLFFIFVMPLVGIYGARRYMLSRTGYRGVRFSQDGSPFDFAWRVLGYWFLNVITLGLFVPFAGCRARRYVFNNMKFGSQPFAFDGGGGALFGPYLLALLLTIPTLGLVWLWYGARKARHYAAHTRAGELSFELTFTTGQYVGLVLTNLVVILLTLGLALPWAVVRSMRFNLQHLEVRGQLDYRSIQQSATRADAVNDGLAEVLDVAGAY